MQQAEMQLLALSVWLSARNLSFRAYDPTAAASDTPFVWLKADR
jgi:hypothetical protein